MAHRVAQKNQAAAAIRVPVTSPNVDRCLPRDAMLARYMLSSCVRPSVCPSVRTSHAGIVPKRLNV